MKKQLFLLLLMGSAWAGLVSFSSNGESDLPMKKINKAITKIWKVEEFEVIDHKLNNVKNCYGNGCWLKVVSGEDDLGMVYIGRVNSCRSGGCAIEPSNEESLAFEFFDYFMLTDTNGEVLWVKVFNYQATQGHEVMSRGWLNQFKGLSASTKVVFGQDIEGISGATVSASAITNDIQDILSCVSTP